MHASRNDDSGRDRQDNAATLLVCANLRAALARFKGDPEVDAWLARVANLEAQAGADRPAEGRIPADAVS